MKVRVEVVCLNADGDEQRRQVLTIERRELAMETLGMNLTESKALLAGVQDFVVSQQAREESELLASAVGRAFSTSQNRQRKAGCVFGVFCDSSARSFPRLETSRSRHRPRRPSMPRAKPWNML